MSAMSIKIFYGIRLIVLISWTREMYDFQAIKTLNVWYDVLEKITQYFAMSGVWFWNIVFSVSALTDMNTHFLPVGECFFCILLACFFHICFLLVCPSICVPRWWGVEYGYTIKEILFWRLLTGYSHDKGEIGA